MQQAVRHGCHQGSQLPGNPRGVAFGPGGREVLLLQKQLLVREWG